MATRNIQMDIEDYRHILIDGTLTLLEWCPDGTLQTVERADFDEDMWDQWNARKTQRLRDQAENARLSEAWEEWTAKRDYYKIHGWDGTPNPWPVGDKVKHENPRDAYKRLTGDARRSVLDRTNHDVYKGTDAVTTKLYVDAARLDKNGMPHDENRIRFSFGRKGISRGELAWLQQICHGESGQRLSSFNTVIMPRGVFAWELAVGNLTRVINTAREHWDVEVNAISNSTDKCTVDCRIAENMECVCVCGSKFHGANFGLTPTEVIIGESLVISSDYRPVTRFYKKNDPEALRWQETGLEWNSDEDPKSLTEIYLQNDL